MTDYPFFAEYFCGITLHPGQVKWLENSQRRLENMLATGNRWGKSLVIAIKKIHSCIYQKRQKQFEGQPYKSLCLSITLDQAKIAWLRVELMMTQRRELSWALKGEPIHKPFPILNFSNGSELWARSTDQPKNLWGHDFDDISFDECAFEKHANEVLPLIRTRLLDRAGVIDFISTPKGKSNWFYRQWLKGKTDPEDYYCQDGPSTENPFISQDAVAKLYDPERMTELQRLQHLEGKFVDFTKSVFRYEDIEWMFEPGMKFETFKSSHRYLDGWDVATKQDKTVGITIDVTTEPYKLVCYESFQSPTPWDVIYDAITKRQKSYHSTTYVDATGIGQHIPEELSELNIIPLVLGPREGPRTTSKTQLIINLQQILERKRLRSPLIPELMDELTFYAWDDKKLQCDGVIALCVALCSPGGGIPEVAFGDFPLGDEMKSLEIKQTLRGRLSVHA